MIVDNFMQLVVGGRGGPSYRGNNVVATLGRVAPVYGQPKRIRVDNGPEFISKELNL